MSTLQNQVSLKFIKRGTESVRPNLEFVIFITKNDMNIKGMYMR